MQILEVHIPDDLVSFLPPQKNKLENHIIDFLRLTYMKISKELSIEQQYLEAAAESK